jgi:hypothetical protein
LALDEWPTLCLVDTPQEKQVRAAAARVRRLEAQLKTARLDLSAAVVAALDTGSKQVTLVRLTEYTREHLRRLALIGRGEDETSKTGT